MPISSSIQFNNKDQVLAAYQNRDVAAWSLWQNKQFMFKGMDEAGLNELLNVLANGGTNATYTLRVYEGIDNDKQIKSNTPDDGSFNFKLNADGQHISPGQYDKVYSNEALIRRVTELESKLDETEAAPNALGKIGDIISHPILAPVIPLVIQKLMDFLFTPPSQTNNLPKQQLTNNPALSLAGIDEDKIIEDCIAKLKKHDRLLAAHLLKLVDIAENQPEIFNAFVNSLT